MSERPFQPSPAELLRANRYQARKRAIAAIVDHYAKAPSTEPALEISVDEAELLRRVLDFSPRGLRRNRYCATPHGSAYRTFMTMRRRGLVTVVEDGGLVVCQATSLGIAALRQVIEKERVA